MTKKTEKDEAHKELTLGDIKRVTRQTNFEIVTYLNLYGCGLNEVSTVGYLKSLTVCLIANNYVTDIGPVLRCRSLVKLDASTNKIGSVPKCDVWTKMTSLKILYLHDNTISKLSVFSELAGVPYLQVLSMFDTPVSLTKHYRHHAVNTIWSLKCLDQLIVSDEEVIEDAKFKKDRFCAYHPDLRIGHLPYISQELTETEAVTQSLKTLKIIEGVLRKHSPVIIIQRAWRAKIQKRRQAEIRELKHWAAVCIQRYWRLKHNIPQVKPAMQHPDIYSPLTHSEPSQTHSPPMPPTASPTATVHGEPREKTPFRISSAKLIESVKAKTSFTKVWGAIPFTAGLEGNVFIKRSDKVKADLNELLIDKTKSIAETASESESELLLVAEKEALKAPATFRDIVTSCKEAGRVVREAANHYKEIQRYQPKVEVKEVKSRVTASNNSQRLFMKLQDSMALSCLKAVQQAYKNRAQVEAQAAKMDKVLLQRHQHKVMLARVDAIKNAARIEALHQREVDDTKLRDHHYKMHEQERRELMTVLKKRETEKNNTKEFKQYKQFMTDFCCQNASLSKALARHDRRTIKDDTASAAQEKVGLLRDSTIRAEKTVKEYLDFVRLRRQAEAQYDRAQISTVLVEEKKRRENEVLERIDHIKLMRTKPTFTSTHPSTDKLLTISDTELIQNYKSSFQIRDNSQTLIKGKAITPGKQSGDFQSSKQPEPTPNSFGFIRFDLSLPSAEDYTSSKANLNADHRHPSEPPKLTRLFLNECSQFPKTPDIAPRQERDVVI